MKSEMFQVVTATTPDLGQEGAARTLQIKGDLRPRSSILAAQTAARELQQVIAALVDAFEQSTGLPVTRIEKVQMVGPSSHIQITVQL